MGYFSIAIPLIFFVWGYTTLKNTDKKLALNISNFLLISGLMLSSLFGVLRFDGLFANHYELAGNIGDFFGSALGRLFGVLGTLILLSTGLFVSLFIAFDLRFRRLRGYLAKLFKKSEEKIRVNIEDKKVKNLEKIKKLKVPKKKDIEEQEDEKASSEFESGSLFAQPEDA